LSLIREFKNVTAPVYDLQVRLIGFREKYKLVDSVETVDFSVKEARDQLTAAHVIEILREGNRRFVEGHPMDRILRGTADRTGDRPKSIVAIFAGIDSRTPVEMIFDLALGDAYVVRMPANVVALGAVGGLEFATSVGGVKLIVVMGHADSSLLSLALENANSLLNKAQLVGCANLESVLEDISLSLDDEEAKSFPGLSVLEQNAFLDQLMRRHVLRSVQQVLKHSQSLQKSVSAGRIAIVGAIFDPKSGSVEFLLPEQTNQSQ
jgi:carbonic anhydrase/SulP family sulfate permease